MPLRFADIGAVSCVCSFGELSKVLDPNSTSVKSDKTAIIADAIAIVRQAREENGQLHQLNKTLEVRIRSTCSVKACSCRTRSDRISFVRALQIPYPMKNHTLHASPSKHLKPA